MNWHELSVKKTDISQELAKSVEIKPGSTMEYVAKLFRSAFTMLKRMIGEFDRRKEKNIDEMSKRRADEANAIIEREKKQYIADFKAVLTRMTGARFEEKRQAVTDHIREMPSDKLNRKLQYIRDYGAMFDKDMWEMFITDPEIISNYIASKIVEHIANKNGIEFASAPIQRTFENINTFQTMINNGIEHIEDEHNLIVMSIISGYPDSPVKKLINDIDTDLATIIPDPKQTILQRLKDAEKKAEDAKDYTLYARIKVFKENHLKELSTPEEMKDELFSQAESLITQGMIEEKGDK